MNCDKCFVKKYFCLNDSTASDVQNVALPKQCGTTVVKLFKSIYSKNTRRNFLTMVTKTISQNNPCFSSKVNIYIHVNSETIKIGMFFEKRNLKIFNYVSHTVSEHHFQTTIFGAFALIFASSNMSYCRYVH